MGYDICTNICVWLLLEVNHVQIWLVITTYVQDMGFGFIIREGDQKSKQQSTMYMITIFRNSRKFKTTKGIIFLYNDLELHHELHMKGQRAGCNLTIKSSGATVIPCCLSSESASSLPRVGLR